MSIAYNASVVTNGLVLCLDAANPRSYPGSGTTWNDVSNSITASLVNSPAYSSSNLGALTFNGTNTYADCGNPASCQLRTAVTLEVWCNPASSTGLGNMIQKNTNSGYRFRIDNGNLWAYSAGNAVISSGAQCTNGSWWHCIATFGPSGLVAYINGVAVASNATAYTPSDAVSGNVQIGCYAPSSETFNGKIAVAKIYNRVLTAIEVAQNFNALRGRYGI